MLRGTDNFALNFGLLVSPDLIKPVTPASVLYYVTEHGGLLGHGQGCHYMLATAQTVGIKNTTSTIFHTNHNPGQDYPSLSRVLS